MMAAIDDCCFIPYASEIKWKLQCDPPKMDSVKNNEGLAVMFVTQVVRGLVSLRSFSVSEPVVYVCGRVSLPNECPGREKPGSMVPFVALYRFVLILPLKLIINCISKWSNSLDRISTYRAFWMNCVDNLREISALMRELLWCDVTQYAYKKLLVVY